MIYVKSPREIELMRQAGKIAAAARSLAREMATPGVTTREIDKAVHDYILDAGAEPSFLGYGGFPGSICISINEEVIHGIPGDRVIRPGDLVSIDVGARYKGFHGDCAGSFLAGGEGTDAAKRLIEVTRQSFFEGIRYALAGKRVTDISAAIQRFVEERGCSVVRDYVGHGVGESLHESPEVPNFGRPDRGPRLIPGMTLAIEPMVNAGGGEIRVLSDRWTVVTADGSLSAHYENTVLITESEPEILTMADDL